MKIPPNVLGFMVCSLHFLDMFSTLWICSLHFLGVSYSTCLTCTQLHVQIDAETFQVTGNAEKCDRKSILPPSNDNDTGEIVCAVTFLWKPSRWSDLFGGVVPFAGPEGYYCASMCDRFEVPSGYHMQNCQIVDTDECEAAQRESKPICLKNALCINRSPLLPTKNHSNITTQLWQGLLNSSGYLCLCASDYFTVQMFPTACDGRGLDLVFFVAENTTLTSLAQNQSIQLRSASRPSTVFVLNTLRTNLLDSIFTNLSEVHSTVSRPLFQAASRYIKDGVVRQDTSGTTQSTLWRIRIRIPSNFIRIQTHTLKHIALLVNRDFEKGLQVSHNAFDALSNSAIFYLHTQTICNVTNSLLQNVCSRDEDCASGHESPSVAAGSAHHPCSLKVAYLQAHLVETNSELQSLDAQSSGFVITSVKFNMASQQWDIMVTNKFPACIRLISIQTL